MPLNTIVTRPLQLYYLYYRPRQSHRVINAANHKNNNNDSEDNDEEPRQLVCTGEHPFYLVQSNDFVQARQIQEGDELLLADGTTAIIVDVDSEKALSDESFTTYNIEVEDFHTYFVGRDGAWVHNASTNPCGVAYDIYHYYRAIRKEGTLGPIQAYEKLEKSALWVDKDLMAKILEEVLPEVFTHTPVDEIWTSGREGSAAKSMWRHYVDHVLINNDVV